MFSLLHAPPLEESPLSLLVPPSAEDGTVLSENWPNTHQCVGTLSAPAPGLFTGSASHENIAGDPHSPAHVPSWLSTSPGRSPRPKHSHDLFLHLPDFHVPPDAHPSATEPFVGIPVTGRRALPTTAELPPATWDGQGALHLLLGAISTWESALTSWHSLSLKKGYWNLYDLLLRYLQAKWPWVKDSTSQGEMRSPDESQACHPDVCGSGSMCTACLRVPDALRSSWWCPRWTACMLCRMSLQGE